MKGGRSSQQQRPYDSTQVSQPHPFAFADVQAYLAAVRELANRDYNPYPGQRIAPLTPLHEGAVNYGTSLFQNDLPAAQNILGQFATGAHAGPGYVHPLLAGAGRPLPGRAGANSQYAPNPWGLTPVGGAGSGVSAPAAGVPSPPGAPPLPSRTPVVTPEIPSALSALGGSGAGMLAAAANAGVPGAGFQGAGGGGPGTHISLGRQNQLFNLPYGTPLGASGGQVILNPAGRGQFLPFNTSKPVTWDEYHRYMALEDNLGLNQVGGGGDSH